VEDVALRYIDSGNRDPNQALGSWLQTALTPEVVELRWQSGFFSVDGLQPFAATLQRLAAADLPAHVLIGSNNGDTQQAHVAQLVSLMGLPRTHARLGVVSFSNAFYHPKTYHVRRDDDSQAAYVGSANLSLAGIGSLHVEAGVIVDTRDGDPPDVLSAIADCVDDWFNQSRTGLELVTNSADVVQLTVSGALSLAPSPRPPDQPSGGPARSGLPNLQPLVRFAPPARATTDALAVRGAGAVAPAGLILPAVPRSPPYPPYVLFAAGGSAPTKGVAALSGASLPSGYVGLIVRLNRDSSRHWRGVPGTSNVSIPVPTISTLRFGMFQGVRPRPRAAYQIEMRYLYPGNDLRATPADTNVMVYGFTPGDPGHGDVRLVLPKPPAQEIANLVQQRSRVLPTDGDVAFLEWPTLQRPTFQLTLIERNTSLFQQAATLFDSANNAHQLVGQGACWLAPNVSPAW
jgi:hypothetical protein